MDTEQEITEALRFGFVDNNIQAIDRLQPALITNNNNCVLDTITDELTSSEAFTIAVAFVTSSGLVDIKTTLSDLNMHGIRGRLITSTYLGFNTPSVFYDLLQIPNLDVRVLNEDGFHTKAYYFDHGNYQSVLIGSSNLTQNALKKNFEWNLRVSSTDRGDVVANVKTGLDDLWERSTPLTVSWIEQYSENWVAIPLPKRRKNKPSKTGIIEPNEMQRDALLALNHLRTVDNAKRGLIVAATGTGKTYLAALDVKEFNPKRFLFIVHREQILRKAMSSFQEVIGGSLDDYGVLSGNQKDFGKKYLFATVNTMSKPSVLSEFTPRDFDYIVVDEAHRVSLEASEGKSTMYQRVLEHFKPKFLLGMTATPERTDGTNVYEYFDYHLAYEISLLDALDKDLLSPFHYIGVTDYEHNGEVIDDTSTLKNLVEDERVDYVLEKTNYYGPIRQDLKGLIFVSRIDEGKILSRKFVERGIPTRFISSEDSIESRESAVGALERGELTYLITVDIFNEGVDIPAINQVVMMRPTKSSIIFLQQLGRGLRKYPGKDSVVVLDFIGNYSENYMIPMAFDRTRTSNKEKIRSIVISPTIQGVSTIHFEEIAKKKILDAVSHAKLDTMKRFRDDYRNLKEKIGLKPPMLTDFARLGRVSIEDIVAKFRTIYHMQSKFEADFDIEFSPHMIKVLEFLSKEVSVAKRPTESFILRRLIEEGPATDKELSDMLKQHEVYCTGNVLATTASILDLTYFMSRNQEKYGGDPVAIRKDGRWKLSESFQGLMKDHSFRNYVFDTITANIWSAKHSSINYSQPLAIGEKYYRSDALKLLDWHAEQNGLNVGGYIKRQDDAVVPVFIALEKTEAFSNKMAYEDEFIDRSTLTWFSKSGRTTESNTEKKVIEHNGYGMIQLFVKKSDDDAKEGNSFYYLGSARVLDAVNTSAKNKDGEDTKLVKFSLRLEHEVETNLYRALTDFE